VDKWKVERKDSQSELADKGTALHEAFENFIPNKTTFDELKEMILTNAKKLGVPEDKYDYNEGALRYWHFENEWLKPLREKGYKVQHESWVTGQIAGHNFIGALDLKITGGADDLHYIVDFKSGASPRTDTYTTQLLLYAYFLGKEAGWDNKKIAENTKIFIFFPLANLGTTKGKLQESERALEALKEIRFTQEDLEVNLKKEEDLVKEIDEIYWPNVGEDRAKVSFACKWCQFAGIPSSLNKECHCDRSRKAYQMSVPRSVKIYKG
jgi:hypothetical protein